ncbi:heparinase II/III family protein [Hoeflea ulvae]|uniref:Heparinase II/III family protein n=1 Tax=Hoeflea ulvae TaxID=2983764 RepID=A0ABT3YA94_9HYPH|nr:heparinase II/III family protein [Hoeflea ulvae]MCY0092796.1 heparinase II/III family protein [Hoeflea ulvae]
MALGRINAMRFAGGVPDRLVVAPIDLRIADSHIAEEIYSGRFAMGGTMVDTGGGSPFQIEVENQAFARSLQGFGWLRHMRAADHDLAFANARALVDDWITVQGRDLGGLAYDPQVLSTRLIAWFSHSPIVLRGADHGFYRRFLKSIALQTRYLRHVTLALPADAIRFRARIALAMASLCLPSSAGTIRSASRLLSAEFDLQILPDGGHISRNPMVLINLLTDLLPLRQTYVNLGQKPPGNMIAGMDRMFTALRFFRHANGELALFNGASAVSADRLLGVLRYDETSGAAYREMPHSHYQRLAAGAVVLIADTGPPPKGNVSATSHAGCLSFELSSGRSRFIVNAGAPVYFHPDHAEFSRLTAAHSTVTFNDTSSVKISHSPFLGPIVTSGVRRVTVKSLDQEGVQLGFSATHDGYVSSLRLLHRREIRLMASGHELHGRDQFLKPDEDNPPASDKTVAVARFHIHPTISVSQDETGVVHLTARDGDSWAFVCNDLKLEIEEDVHFADLAGARTSKQITLTCVVGECAQVDWQLIRTTLPRSMS